MTAPSSFAQTKWGRAREWIGQGVAVVDTPSLVIDLDAMERNLARMAAFAGERGLRLRPHAKMHKSVELARLQIAHGAVGVCVQKIEEALVLAQGGVHDVLITNEVVASQKLRRLAEAVRDLPTRFGLAVDSTLGLERLADAMTEAGVRGEHRVDVYIEVDVGHGRCGVPPGEAALVLAHGILANPVLHFAGLQAYHGSAQHRRSPAERAQAIGEAAWIAAQARERLQSGGFSVPLVTGAGTGSFVLEASSRVWGELQAGSYLFMDADYARNEPAPQTPVFEHALFVKSQVMSRCAQHAVCDAGHKSHAIDSGLPAVWRPGGLTYANGGDEHGLLRGTTPPALGETVWLVPGHCDPTVNLHDFMVGVRGGILEGHVERLIAVDARGALG